MALFQFPLMGSFKSFLFQNSEEGNYVIKIAIDKQSIARNSYTNNEIPLFYIIRSYSDDEKTVQDSLDVLVDGLPNEGSAVVYKTLAQNSLVAATPVPYVGTMKNVTGKNIEVLLYNGLSGGVFGTVDCVKGQCFRSKSVAAYSAPLNGNDLNETLIDIPDFAYEYKIVPTFSSDAIGWPTVQQLGAADIVAFPATFISNNIISDKFQSISHLALGLQILYLTGDATNNQAGFVVFKVVS